MLDPFEQRRNQVLQGLKTQELDKSRAGGVDARIQGLVECMNQHPDLYTTSSCSGTALRHSCSPLRLMATQTLQKIMSNRDFLLTPYKNGMF